MQARTIFLASVGCILSVAVARTEAAAGSPPPEFDGQDAMALVDRQHVKTDCKIDWVAKSGKRYCFGSDKAKTDFTKNADENIQKADDMSAAETVRQVDEAMGKFTAKDAKQLVVDEIEAKQKANGGTYTINDTVTNTSIPLVFDSVDFTRTIRGYGFFPDVRFHAKDDAQKKYVVDYWVVPKNGKLVTMEERIYKAPFKNGNDWTMMQRQPKPWWWIPASEHPGEVEQKRSWEVMSSIDKYVQNQMKRNNGVFELKDDKTGQTIPMKFLYVHQPVRRLKSNGVFFACTDFRKAGSKDEIYDIDFWLDDKTGKVSVNQVKVHKVPELHDGSMVQIPRYEFDPKTYDQVP